MSMEIIREMREHDYEQVVFCSHKSSGLRAIIVIHDTTLGPAIGGTRMWPYKTEEEAITDGLRLARGMTYKCAAAGLNLGGGKAVIIGDPRKDKSEGLFRAFGRFVDTLGGRFITGEDVGITLEDVDLIGSETRWVGGSSESSGDPGPVTAYGVWHGLKACAKAAFGDDSLKGLTIAIQGAGNVGYHLAKHLNQEGANLIISDIFPDKVERAEQEFGAKAVEPEEIYKVPCDIFAPCALGAIINDDTIPQLKCKVVAGSANNQLKEDKHGAALEDRGILYAPDFIINAGGVINVADGLYGYNRERAMKKAQGIYDILLRVFEISKQDKIPTNNAALKLAEERIELIAQLSARIRKGPGKGLIL
ncbi:MAG TPA: Glu/Leu/Phe/Val dehydrogenase dimerization domain-containing protein [Bacillota bacterium]|nr:Glu/Leu/Phe/Val dehydrogenase dimerization domain-containing protein [Bacillota bacterium]